MIQFINNDTGQTVNWVIGQGVPGINQAGNFTAVADGAEKTLIKDNFPGLPFHRGVDRIIWRGDNARFLADNVGLV
jgi:hypothetical protein